MNHKDTLGFSEGAVRVLEARYLARNDKGEVIETIDEMFRRVAKAVASVEEPEVREQYEEKFYQMMINREFLPNSPTLMNAGRKLGQLSACFVLPVEDSMEGIFTTLKHAALIHKSGGGTGFSFNRLRSKDSIVKSTGGKASGPISFMQVYNHATGAVIQGGTRRGANMGILNVNHPDILEFIQCKMIDGELENFNISVGITDKFMQAVINEEAYALVEPSTNETVKMIDANMVFDLIVRMAWLNGEPGLIFLDEINRGNTLNEQIEATNPCVTGDTLIPTGEGLVTIAELYERYSEGKELPSLLVDNRVSKQWRTPCLELGSWSARRITAVYNNGEKEVFKLTTESEHMIEATANHQFMTLDGWKELKELKVGDRVLAGNITEGLYQARVETVASIESAGTEIVYDLTEPVTSSYIGNGFVIHNCGEQSLLPYESCNLGSINVASCCKDGRVDTLKLQRLTKLAVRFLDNVIDINKYPLPEIEKATRRTRKIGLGVMGLADALISMNESYDSITGMNNARYMMHTINETARGESAALAVERGACEADNSVRNYTRTTIAPTGTISMIADVSSGIEPLFAVAFTRRALDGEEFIEVNKQFEQIAKEQGFHSEELMQKVAKTGSIQHIESIPAEIRRLFVTAHDIEPEAHIDMQAVFQMHVDNAISKTINFPNDAKPADVKRAFLHAYENKCKGITVYRDGSRQEQVLSAGTSKSKAESVVESKDSVYHNPTATAKVTFDEPIEYKLTARPRPPVTVGITEKVKIGCGNLYVTVNADDSGVCEVFTNLGRAGGCPSQSEATARLISLSLRSGVDVEDVIEQLKGIRCLSTIRKSENLTVLSCPDAIGKTIEKYMSDLTDMPSGLKQTTQQVNNSKALCPECSNEITNEGGCNICKHCGYSRCS